MHRRRPGPAPQRLGIYFTIREKVRSNPSFQRLFYLAEGLRAAMRGGLAGAIERRAALVPGPPEGVALCARIKDEAAVLPEWIEYYRVAGIRHFFFYESFSSDNFREVLQPYIEQGLVTLIADFPRVPVTPAAEEDCVLRALNRYEWVGFLDVDEFLVLRDGVAIPDFLARYPGQAAVAFHWIYFGTSGHVVRPAGSVIHSYTRRNAQPNRHIKTFLRPETVTHCRNPHSWQYRGLRHAVTEAGDPVYGSFIMQPNVRDGWIAHFHCKSEQEYLAKIHKQEACDRVAMKYHRRSEESLRRLLVESNRVEDFSVQEYYRSRCEQLGIFPDLLKPPVLSTLQVR